MQTWEARVRKLGLAVLLLFSCACLLRAQQAQNCFKPLKDPLSTHMEDWREDFINFTPTVKPEGVDHLHLLKDGAGTTINLDFYSVTFRKPNDPNKTIETVFKDIRLHFRQFVAGDRREGDSIGADFVPYGASPDQNDRLYNINKKLWQSDNPKGALMSFTFMTVTVGAIPRGGGVPFVLEQGDVVCECASKRDFIFTTAYTGQHTEHPVSGNRGFGIKDNENGTWTVYAMASDRETKSSLTGMSYLGNIILKANLPLAPVEGGEEAVFREGHKFWLVFFPNMLDYLDSQGMKAVPNSFIQNSRRYPFVEPNPRPGPTPNPPSPNPPPNPSPNPRPGPTPAPTPRP